MKTYRVELRYRNAPTFTVAELSAADKKAAMSLALMMAHSSGYRGKHSKAKITEVAA